MKLSIGIDPGKDGAIVCIADTNVQSTFLIPRINSTLVDLKKLNEIFSNIKKQQYTSIMVGLEQVHAIFGSAAGATFEFGRIYGILEALISANDLPFMLVQPKLWQKEMFTGVPEIRKPGKEIVKKDGTKVVRQGSLKTKEMALVAVKRLFPNLDLRQTPRCTNFHDGLVDATLIAEWVRRHTAS